MVIKFGYKTYITIDYISFYIKSILEPIFQKIFGVCSVHQTMFHVNFPDGHAELLCLHTGSKITKLCHVLDWIIKSTF